jgi:hypothetical protein
LVALRHTADGSCRWQLQIARFHEKQNVPNLILGSSSQSFTEHDLNMQLDSGFHAVFACWLHVCSAAELRISIAW